MLVFDENSKPLIIDSIYTPTLTSHVWILDLSIMDFTLAPLEVLEEITCPSVMIEVCGFKFILPAHWYVLVYDEETTQVDTVCVSELSGREFMALGYGPNKNKAFPAKIVVVDYNAQFKNVGPSLNKHQMLCHPIGPNAWINISPTDVYNKYLKDVIVGDII